MAVGMKPAMRDDESISLLVQQEQPCTVCLAYAGNLRKAPLYGFVEIGVMDVFGSDGGDGVFQMQARLCSVYFLSVMS